jgi:glycosyltransferase involved in cell wall biosynthesis
MKWRISLNSEDDFKNGTATFIMPMYVCDDRDIQFLDESIQSVKSQSDSNWRLIIINDRSIFSGLKNYLSAIKRELSEKIIILENELNSGPGFSRNKGIQVAHSLNSPFIIYLDSDDAAHDERLGIIRSTFIKKPQIDIIYHKFSIIDENSNVIAKDKCTPSIVEIIEALEHNPPCGKNAWIRIGTDTGYCNLTSATAVKTTLAIRYPFPAEYVSEDAHTWLRYCAAGYLEFVKENLTNYRIPNTTVGSSSRSRVGREQFYKKMVEVNLQGFNEAMQIALDSGNIIEGSKNALLSNFHKHYEMTLKKEGLSSLAEEQAFLSEKYNKAIHSVDLQR